MLNHNSWVAVREGCPMSYHFAHEGEAVDFTFGQLANCFELGFDTEGLREFLRLGTEALEKLDTVRHTGSTGGVP